MTDGSEKALTLHWSDYSLELDRRTHVMGVLNVTPDSFSDGGLFFAGDRALEHGLAMAAEGADIIDVGGESTRPYSSGVPLEEELNRVIPVIEGLRARVEIPISIDTLKAEVARQAVRAGASIINDVSALRFDPEMVSVAAEVRVPVILMHMKGAPGDMQDKPSYVDVVQEIMDFLREVSARAEAGGVDGRMIILDPGIGFGKTFDHNLQIIRDLKRFHTLGKPLLLGSSNKAFIGHILNRKPQERDTGTMATVAAGALNGAHIVRVHNVLKAVETVKIIDAIRRGSVD